MVQGKRNIKYVICILAMILLLLSAALGPQFLFAIQDGHIQEKVSTGERDRMDLTVLDAGYTKVLRERFTNYAEGLQEERQYYTAVTECEKDAECYSILENVLSSEWLTFLNDMGLTYMVYDSIQTGYTVEEWKRYVIYDVELQNGVAVMAWYFLITIEEDIQMKLLVDVEDDTIYQLQIIASNEKYYDYYALGIDYEDIIALVPLYWFYYYDAGEATEESVQEYLKDIVYETYIDKGKYDIVVSNDSNTQFYGNEIVMDEDSVMVRKELPYEEYQLQWEMRLEQEPEGQVNRMSMGITNIAEMLPEFSAN